MTMLWVGVGAAVLGAGASVYGANKQAKGAAKAGQLNMDMFNTLNSQQQPFIQSGYGSLSKLNTLLGLSPRSGPQMSTPMTAGGMPGSMAQGDAGPRDSQGVPYSLYPGGQPPGNAYMPTPGGGVQPIMQGGQPSAPIRWNVPEAGMGNLPLRRILAMRAQNGDRQAQAMLTRLS